MAAMRKSAITVISKFAVTILITVLICIFVYINSVIAQDLIIQPHQVQINQTDVVELQHRNRAKLEVFEVTEFQTSPQGYFFQPQVDFRWEEHVQPQRTVYLYEGNIEQVQISYLDQVNQDFISRISDAELFSFPEVHHDSRDSRSSDGGPLIYQPVISSKKPLVYDYNSDQFSSSLSFFLLSQDQGSDRLTNPVFLEIHSDILNVIDPGQLEISHLNIPSTDVYLQGKQVRDSVQIRILTEANLTEGYEIFLNVVPALNLFTNRSQMQGLGIQEIPLQVSWKGSGSEVLTKVSLSSSKGEITPKTVWIPYNGSKTVYLRSENLGEVVIIAESMGLQSNPVYITYIFPWIFLLFSIIGGLTGGVAKYFVIKKNHPSFFKTIIGSIAIGLIGALAYFVLGVNLLSLEFSSTLNEFAVFTVSALIAFMGIRKIKSE